MVHVGFDRKCCGVLHRLQTWKPNSPCARDLVYESTSRKKSRLISADNPSTYDTTATTTEFHQTISIHLRGKTGNVFEALTKNRGAIRAANVDPSCGGGADTVKQRLKHQDKSQKAKEWIITNHTWGTSALRSSVVNLSNAQPSMSAVTKISLIDCETPFLFKSETKAGGDNANRQHSPCLATSWRLVQRSTPPQRNAGPSWLSVALEKERVPYWHITLRSGLYPPRL
jgi:hypothetical protein